MVVKFHPESRIDVSLATLTFHILYLTSAYIEAISFLSLSPFPSHLIPLSNLQLRLHHLQKACMWHQLLDMLSKNI